MYPLLRFAKVLLRRLTRRHRIGPEGESLLTFRVWPGDLDFNFHLNDGRYLTLMDFGRVDFLLGLGLFRAARRHGWYPIVASAHIDFRKEVKLFQKLRLRTRILSWDERWIYLEHELERGDRVVANALLKGAIRGPQGVVAPAEVLRAIGGRERAAPPMPERLRRWLDADAKEPALPPRTV